MKGFCGADCSLCEKYKINKCVGCRESNGCPFGKECWIKKYISLSGDKEFDKFKNMLISEINSLSVEFMDEVKELIPLNGEYVNLEYKLPNGLTVKFLDDSEVYLGAQVESKYNEGIERCYGVIANMNFILISEYGENGVNPELLVYKKR